MDAWKRLCSRIVLPGCLGVLIGGVVGAVDAVFGRGLLWLSAVREAHVPLVLLLAPAGALIAWAYGRYGKGSERGMGLVFAAGRGEEAEIPLRLIPLIISGTWLTHLFGGSAGREGVAVQIGATVGHAVGRRLDREESGKIFLVAGMAAGFSGLFETPVAAVFFAMEVMTAGALEYAALFPAATASLTACTVSRLLGLGRFQVELGAPPAFDAGTLAVVAAAGILFGLTGGGFARALAWAKKRFAAWLPRPVIRIAVLGAGLSALFLLLGQGRYSGLGTNLISAATGGGTIYGFDFALKLLLTVLTLAAGFQGGEVTPLFAVGASLGAALAPLLGLDPVFLAALGYAAVFGGATNTLLAPIFIGGEVFGFQSLPWFALACGMAYVFNGNASIYSAQRRL